MRNKYEKGSIDTDSILGLAAIALVLSAFAAWITHVVVCLSAGKWGFLIAGAILAPIGVIHGYGLWFGFF